MRTATRANARVETRHDAPTLTAMTEIIFEVREDDVDGGYNASALGFGIHTQGDTLEELRANVREAVDCYFDETMEAPKVIRLHFVRDEVLAR
jgi:predicted RNase H-like HicB family nuclease